MKRFASGLAAAACALLGGPAAAVGFSGPLAPANWTTTISGPAFGSAIDTATAPASITLVGGDDASMAGCPGGTSAGFIGACEIDYTIAMAAQYSFHWSYATTDISPQYDQFGVIVDGVRTELIANGGDLAQSGDFSVNAHSSFGWYINCTDCTGGGPGVTISSISAVPEMPTLLLLPAGLAALGLWRRSRRSAA